MMAKAPTTYTKQYTQKQLAAHERSRRVFARAREIWSGVPNCDPYGALRQAWAEEKAKPKTNGRRGGYMAHSNPYSGLRMLRVNPGAEIVEDGGKFHIYMDGAPTGKYYMTRQKAEEKASQM